MCRMLNTSYQSAQNNMYLYSVHHGAAIFYAHICCDCVTVTCDVVQLYDYCTAVYRRNL